MRILAFNYEYPPLGGGGGVLFKQLAEELSTRHQITLVTSRFGDEPQYERAGDLEIYRVPVLLRNSVRTASLPSMLSYWPSSERFGSKLLRKQRFDVLNSHFVVPSSPSAARLARRYGVPHVISILGGDIFDPSKKLSPHRTPLLRGLVRSLLRSADRVVAGSSDVRSKAQRLYDLSRDIDVISLGFRSNPQGPVSRRELGLPDDAFVLATVGRLIPRKGLDELLRAVAELGDPRALLLVMGDGPLRGDLQAQAAELGIANQVRFLGFVEEQRKLELLAASDAYVSTSLHEGFGLVFLEAMDQGLPIVAYNHGGQTDFLDDGATGLLVEAGQRGEFVEALRRLRNSPERGRAWGESNRRSVLRYTIENCARQYEELFLETVGAPLGAVSHRTSAPTPAI